MGTAAAALGKEFAEALAAKDFERVRTLVDAKVDFRGLTPRRAWEAAGSEALVDDVLPSWLEDSDHVDEMLEVESGSFADCEHVRYSFRGHDDKGQFVVEQHAYFTARDGRIDWMRVLCSGFRRT